MAEVKHSLPERISPSTENTASSPKRSFRSNIRSRTRQFRVFFSKLPTDPKPLTSKQRKLKLSLTDPKPLTSKQRKLRLSDKVEGQSTGREYAGINASLDSLYGNKPHYSNKKHLHIVEKIVGNSYGTYTAEALNAFSSLLCARKADGNMLRIVETVVDGVPGATMKHAFNFLQARLKNKTIDSGDFDGRRFVRLCNTIGGGLSSKDAESAFPLLGKLYDSPDFDQKKFYAEKNIEKFVSFCKQEGFVEKFDASRFLPAKPEKSTERVDFSKFFLPNDLGGSQIPAPQP